LVKHSELELKVSNKRMKMLNLMRLVIMVKERILPKLRKEMLIHH
jgi:hypothetical protein